MSTDSPAVESEAAETKAASPREQRRQNKPKPRSIYTWLLGLSFLALCIGVLAMYLELRRYDMQLKVPPNVGESAAPAE